MSRVATVPRVILEIGGVPAPDDVIASLAELRVSERLSCPVQCELTFRDISGMPIDLSLFEPGSSLTAGIEGDSELLFDGEVTAVEHIHGPLRYRELRVRGYHRLHRLRKAQPLRSLNGVTARSLAEELASGLGMTVSAAEEGPEWRVLTQHRESNLDLLERLCWRCGLYFTARRDELRLVTLEGDGKPVPLALGENLLEARVELNGDRVCREFAISGWDPNLAGALSGDAGTARSGRTVSAEVSPKRVGADPRREASGEVAPSDAHLDSLAQAEMDRRTGGEVTLWGVAQGDVDITAGGIVSVQGLDGSLNGHYVVTETTHTIDERMGFITEFSTASPSPPADGSPGRFATLGIVSSIDDPKRAGRVKARLPAYGGIETDWMAVAAVGAGAGKGIVALPDVEDRVLVLMPNDDPASGVVVGALYGEEGPFDPGLEEGTVQRYTMQTPGGQSTVLDDARGSLRVENSDGSYLEMTPEKVRLHSSTDLEIDAPGRAITVRAKTVDFVRADEAEEKTDS